MNQTHHYFNSLNYLFVFLNLVINFNNLKKSFHLDLNLKLSILVYLILDN